MDVQKKRELKTRTVQGIVVLVQGALAGSHCEKAKRSAASARSSALTNESGLPQTRHLKKEVRCHHNRTCPCKVVDGFSKYAVRSPGTNGSICMAIMHQQPN